MLLLRLTAPAPSCQEVGQNCRESLTWTYVSAATQLAAIFPGLIVTKHAVGFLKRWDMCYTAAIFGVKKFSIQNDRSDLCLHTSPLHSI